MGSLICIKQQIHFPADESDYSPERNIPDTNMRCWRVSGYRVFGFTSGVMQQIRELKKLDCYVLIAQPMLGTRALLKSDETG